MTLSVQPIKSGFNLGRSQTILRVSIYVIGKQYAQTLAFAVAAADNSVGYVRNVQILTACGAQIRYSDVSELENKGLKA